MLISPPALLAFAGTIDIALTLLGQTLEYWAGNYSKAREGNPLAEPLLITSPWLFAVAATAWVVALIVLLHFWNHRLADGIALVAFAGHTFGGAAWMLNLWTYGWSVAVAYVTVMIGLWSLVNRRQRVVPAGR